TRCYRDWSSDVCSSDLETLDVGRLRDVGDDGLSAVALAMDDADGLLHRLALEVDRHHVRALACEEHGRGLAVAPAGPRRAGASEIGRASCRERGSAQGV